MAMDACLGGAENFPRSYDAPPESIKLLDEEGCADNGDGSSAGESDDRR